MKCQRENNCDISLLIKQIAEENKVTEEKVQCIIKEWLDKNSNN